MKKTTILSLLLSAFIASAAQAGNIYIGGGIYSSDSEAVIEAAENFDLDGSDTAQAVFLGYKFTNGIAVEAGYYDLGKFSSEIGGDSGFVNSDALSASIVARINVIPIVSIYGKAGYAYIENDIKFDSDLLDSITDDDSSTDPLFGLGVDVTLGKSFSIYGEYIRFDNNAQVDLIGAGVRFTF